VAAQNALQLKVVLTEVEREAALMQWGAVSRRRVLVNVSAGRAFRQWPNENFVAVAKHLKERLPDACVMILHVPAERERAQAIAAAAGVARGNTPSVREALAMVATAHFVFTPDTSIVHAASAFCTPTVAMITDDQAKHWGLFGTVGEVVVYPGDTLATLPLENVIEAIDKVLITLAS